jgi:hypothetical protein
MASPSPDVSRRFGLVESLIAAISVLTLVAFFRLWRRLLGFFWDISVYERAATDYLQGVDAYRRDVRFPFVYHPLVLRALAYLKALISLKVLFPALTLAAVAWFFVELSRAEGGSPANGQTRDTLDTRAIDPTRVGLGLIAAAGFGGIGIPALMSGNLSPLIHFTLMAAFLRGGRATGAFWRYLPYGLIFLCALVKPYLLIYLALPVLVYESRVKALVCSALVAALFALTWLSFKLQWPAEYTSFVANLSWHILGRGDVGYSFFYVFAALTHKIPLALALHALLSLVLIALVPLLFTQKYGRQPPAVPRLMVLYLVLTVANPRMKDYDLFPALAGFFAVFGLISPRAAPITLAGLLVASMPPIVGFFASDMGMRHPQLLDPFGNWQILGLALLAILFLTEMQAGQSATKGAYHTVSRE